jgi:hypothetical protein
VAGKKERPEDLWKSVMDCHFPGSCEECPDHQRFASPLETAFVPPHFIADALLAENSPPRKKRRKGADPKVLGTSQNWER